MHTHSATAPFDRHDWVISRPDGSTARYVIDYYGDDEGEAEDERRRLDRGRSGANVNANNDDDDDDDFNAARFVLDVRPALDSFAALKVRAQRAFAAAPAPAAEQSPT